MKRLLFLKKYMLSNKKAFVFAFAILLFRSFLNIMPALIIKRVFDYGFANKDMHNIIFPALLLLILYFVMCILNYKSLYIVNHWAQSTISKIRDELTQKLLSLPMEFFDLNEPGYVAARIGEVNNLSNIFSQSVMKSAIGIFEFVGALIILSNIHIGLMLCLLLLTPLFALLSRKYAKALTLTTNSVLEQSSHLSSRLQQSFKNIEEVKSLSIEKQEHSVLKKANSKLLKSNIKQADMISKSTEMLTFLGHASTVFLIILGGYLVTKSSLTVGDYMVFSTYLGMLYAPVQSISLLSLTLAPAFTSLDRIIDFISEVDESEDDSEKEQLKFIDNVEFKNVCFSYKTNHANVLDKLCFTIKNGEKVCIKGPNGSGKTTIFRLILSLYEPQSGKILINGLAHVNFQKASIRQRISVVSQKIHLFPGTIEENIKYGCDLSDKDYSKKVEELQLKNLLQELPLDTKITDGSNLSGGQIQRIAIARGLIKNADLFLFDESTSNLDEHGIRSLVECICNVLVGKTCLFIEHGTTLDSVCDKTIVLHPLSDYGRQ